MTGHMTPALIAQALEKISSDVTVFISHVKPAFKQQVLNDLESHERTKGMIHLESGMTFTL